MEVTPKQNLSVYVPRLFVESMTQWNIRFVSKGELIARVKINQV
jgi:hypothetical protein